MNDGPKREPTKDLLDFMRKHWLEGTGSDRILFNTLSNQDLQRRVFSHSKRRIDIVGPSTGTQHAENLLAKIPELTQPDGPFSFPFTQEKITKIYEEFEVLAKDITEHAGWDEFWLDWETKFKEAILESPANYLTEEELSEYQLKGETFIDDFIQKQKPEVQLRVKGGYCFKMLTELLANPKIPKSNKLDKDVCVMLQTISNHKDSYTPEQMSHYVNDSQEARLHNRIKSAREQIFVKTKLYNDPESTVSEQEIKEIIQKLVYGYDEVTQEPGKEPVTIHHEGIVDSKEYKQMDKERRDKLIEDNFISRRAMDGILDNIEKRGMYKNLRNKASEFTSNPSNKSLFDNNPAHLQKLQKLMNLADSQEVGFVDIALDSSEMGEIFSSFEKTSDLCAKMELLLAHEHLNRELDSLVQKVLHGTKSKEELEAHLKQISANDHVNNDHASVAHLVDLQIQKLNAKSPTLDELVELRRAFELDPSDKNREDYYNAIERAKALPEESINECLNVAKIREKWMVKITSETKTWAGDFIESAQENLQAFGPPMTESKMIMLCRELQDLNDNLLDDPEFKEDMAKLPVDLQEKTKIHLAEQFRRLAIDKCAFVDETNLTAEQVQTKKSQISSIFLAVNSQFDKAPGVSIKEKAQHIHRELLQEKSQKLESEVSRVCDKVKQSILDGKKMVDAISELEGHVNRIKMSDYHHYLEDHKAEAGLEPMTQMLEDYKHILELVNTELNDIGDKFVPSGGKDSGNVVHELIEKASNSIQEDAAFKRRPYVGNLALQRHIMSQEAQQKIKEKAATARTEHFGKKISSLLQDQNFESKLKTLIENKQDGLKWIRFHPARREVLSRLATDITNGEHGFSKRNGFQKFFGLSLTGKQQTAIKALQKEFLLCLKIELAQAATNEEALKILEANQYHPLLKPIDKASFGQLFSKKDKSAKNEIDNLMRVISKAPKQSSPSQLSILSPYQGMEADQEKQNEFSYRTSPEFDVVDGLNARLSKVLSEEDMLKKASEMSMLEDKKNKQIESLKDPNKHQELLENLNKIENPKERMEEIQSLFAMAHNNQMFDYHNRMHIQHKEYGPVQEKAIVMLQEAYIEAMRQEMFKQVWMCKDGHFDPDVHQYRRSDFDFSEDNLHPLSFPKDLESKHKNEIYSELLGPAKNTSILMCDVREGRLAEIKTALSDMTEILNHVYDPGTPDSMRQQMDKQSKERLGTSEPESRSRLRH